jgi:hypothetical protein
LVDVPGDKTAEDSEDVTADNRIPEDTEDGTGIELAEDSEDVTAGDETAEDIDDDAGDKQSVVQITA